MYTRIFSFFVRNESACPLSIVYFIGSSNPGMLEANGISENSTFDPLLAKHVTKVSISSFFFSIFFFSFFLSFSFVFPNDYTAAVGAFYVKLCEC